MRESIRKLVKEKLMLKSWGDYAKLVAAAYEAAPDYDASVVHHWNSLNQSNYTLFKRLLSKVKIIFTTNNEGNIGNVNILGREYKIVYHAGEPYTTQTEMKADFQKTGTLKISIDYSDHPVFSLVDNIVFRTVHDFIVHILGNKQFGSQGEIASYNLHAKLVPKDAIPAIFTEVVGQACVAVTTGSFPQKQKIAILKGFDYINVGKVDDASLEIKNKELKNK